MEELYLKILQIMAIILVPAVGWLIKKVFEFSSKIAVQEEQIENLEKTDARLEDLTKKIGKMNESLITVATEVKYLNGRYNV